MDTTGVMDTNMSERGPLVHVPPDQEREVRLPVNLCQSPPPPEGKATGLEILSITGSHQTQMGEVDEPGIPCTANLLHVLSVTSCRLWPPLVTHLTGLAWLSRVTHMSWVAHLVSWIPCMPWVAYVACLVHVA